MRAGELTELVAFEKREDLSGNSPPGDGHGNMEGDFAEVFQQAANFLFVRGQEQVLAQRLQGVQPLVMTIRSSVQARTVTPAWRARVARAGRQLPLNTYINIRSIAPNREDPSGLLDLLCETGVAT